MADLGAIGKTLPGPAAGFNVPNWRPTTSGRVALPGPQRRILPVWAQDYRPLLAIPVDGTLSGVVKEAGATVEGVTVRLYYRPTGALIDGARSAADGSFSFSGLEAGLAQYYVLAIDPDSGALYNAQVLDRVAPV